MTAVFVLRFGNLFELDVDLVCFCIVDYAHLPFDELLEVFCNARIIAQMDRHQ